MQPVAILTIMRDEERYFFHLDRPVALTKPAKVHLHAPGSLYVSVSFQDALRTQIETAVDEAAELLLHFAAEKESRAQGVGDRLLRVGALLYNLLLPPFLQNALASLPEELPLVLATNDPNLPWELLHDGRQYLALQHPLGRQFLLGRHTFKPTTETVTQRSFLFIANPTDDLLEAAHEVERLLDMFDTAPEGINVTVLAGSRANKFEILQHLGSGRYDLIHYSGHATSNSLLLNDGELNAEEIQRSLGGHPFVFLNACSTAVEDTISPDHSLPYTGLAMQGLASAFVFGGAVGVIGARRRIFDRSSRQFAERFYALALDGIPVGEILRRLRHRAYSERPHDPLWTSYLLYGDPRLQIAGLEHTELRTVTLLSARLSGLWQLYENCSLEQAAMYEDDLVQQLVHAAHQRGGEVMGPRTETLTICFGLSRPHEDDAERGVHGAFDMLTTLQAFNQARADSLPAPITLAIGVGTGKALIRRQTSPETVEHQITGNVVDRAIVLAAQASVGQVLIDDVTHRLIERQFQCEPCPPVPLPESTGTLVAYRVVAEKKETIPLGPTISRERELHQLQNWWREAAIGQGRLVDIFGAAGIGKTRLVYTFHAQLSTEEHQWLEVSCQRPDTDRTHGLVSQIVHQLAGIVADDDEATRHRKLHSLLEDTFDNVEYGAEEIGMGLALLGQLVDAPFSLPAVDNLDSELRQRNLARMIQAILARRTAVRPIVLVLEDMQWSDNASLAVLDQVMRALGRMRLLIVVTYRSEWKHSWPRPEHCRPLPLSELDNEGRRLLLAELLGVEITPPTVAGPILEQTGGNPFFIEELVRTLQESGDLVCAQGGWKLVRNLAESPLPNRIERVIWDRIQRLDEESRWILQSAAVIGQRFEQSILYEIQDEVNREHLVDQLDDLIDRRFIVELLENWPLQYSFTHGFIHQSAYESILERPRRVLHRLVARALLRLPGPEQTARIAYHLYRSDERVQAIRYCLFAAQTAADAWDNEGAIRWCERALTKIESFSQEPASNEEKAEGASEEQVVRWRIEALERMADVLSAIGRNSQALESYRRALEEMEGLAGVPSTRSAALWGKIAIAHQNRGEFSQAQAALQAGLKTLDGLNSPELGRLHVWMGLLAYRQGTGLSEGLASCEQGIRLLQETESVQDLAQAYNLQGVLLHELGRSREALAAHEHSIALYQEAQHLPGEQRAINNRGCIYQDLGQWEQALQDFMRVEQLAARTGEIWYQAAAAINLGEIYRRQGRLEQAEDSYLSAQQLAEEFDIEELAALAQMNRGVVALQDGRTEEAAILLEESIAHFRQLDGERHLPEALRWLAEVRAEQGCLDEALALAQEALHQATEQEVQIEMGHARRVLGRLHRLQGEWEPAQEQLALALANFEEHHNLHETALTLLERALLFEARADAGGDAQLLHQALADCESALERFTRLGAQLDAQDARAFAERLRARLQG